MAPLRTSARLQAQRLPGAGLDLDTDIDTRNGTQSARQDSNGPGSTWGRTHGSFGVQHDHDKGYDANQPSQADGASNGRNASQGIHHQRMSAGSGGSRFSRLSVEYGAIEIGFLRVASSISKSSS